MNAAMELFIFLSSMFSRVFQRGSRTVTMFLLLLSISGIHSQESGAPIESGGGIKANVQIDKRNVPLNRTLHFTIEVSWQGDLDRYQIERVETPSLSNLEIVGNASSNRVGDIAGNRQAIKTFEFDLQPVSLGMGYIEGTVISYRDSSSDNIQRLVTNRLQVEITPAISDSHSLRWILIIFGCTGVFLFAVGFFFFRKRRSGQADRVEVELILLEDRYLETIKGSVDLQGADAVTAFSALAKHFKHYLSERYHVPFPEVNVKEISAEMNRQGVPEKIIEQTGEVLRTADVARFSGGQVEKGVLERAYTLVEDILIRNRNDFIQYSNTIDGNNN